MKTTKQIWLALMLLPMLCACQSDDIENDIKEEIPASEPRTIKAALPGSDDKSRAQITDGNQDVAAGEKFMWNIEDEIVAYSQNTQKSRVYQIMDLSHINGKSATFTMTQGVYNDAEFYGREGVANYFIATYGAEFDPDIAQKGPCIINADKRVPQVKSQGTPGNADTEHLRKMLKMVAYQQVGSSSETPDFQFKHLSSIMRITLRNKRDQINVEQVIFKYGQNATFYTGKLEANLEEFNGEGNPAYTGSTTNDWDSGEMDITLAPGESYDLYFAVLSSAKAPGSNDKLKITMYIDSHGVATEIEGFNVAIKPGYRYWFDLTLTDTGLVQTSKLP